MKQYKAWELLPEEKVHLKSEVDAVVTEFKAEVNNLLMQNHELCQSVQVMYYKEEYGKLQKEIESLKASHYAEMVDAGMRERKLKRALWLARADRADDRARIFYFNDLETMLDIDGFSYDPKKKKGHKKFSARLWRIIWLKVERKCLKKAEEYK